MSPLPAQLSNHWWRRPGQRPGRELYHWHLLFHDQPAVHAMVADAQRKLTDLPELDLVPLSWLHLTTLVVGFADAVPSAAVEIMAEQASQRLAGLAPIPVTLGRVIYHTEAVVLTPEPFGALDPVLAAVSAATAAAGLPSQSDTQPWLPHIAIAYANSTSPAAPVIAALGRWLPTAEITIKSASLVAQTQVGHSWQWRPVAEASLRG